MQKISLVLILVDRAPHIQRPIVGLLDACIMAGGHVLGVPGLGQAQQRTEFYAAVALDAGVRRAALQIVFDEQVNDGALEDLVEIEHIVRDAERFTDALGIGEVLGRAAAAEAGGLARQQLEGDADDLMAGVAGLLAGAFSMAAGEYVSMRSQRELFERQIDLERQELEISPEEEERELSLIYQAKGLRKEEADLTAARLMEDPEVALDTLVREELGLDPSQLGAPWGAAIGSFLAFAVGAFVPVIPFLFGEASTAYVAASAALSAVALFGLGAGVSLFTGRSALYSGARQVAIGAGAATVTFVIGGIIGASADL